MQVAAIQMASGTNLSANLLEAERLIAEAATSGAGLVVLPENFGLMLTPGIGGVAAAEPEGKGVIQGFLAEQALRHRIWLVGGTLPLRTSESSRAYAATLVYSPDGERVARYDKMHLFDVELETGHERYHESADIKAGSRVVCVDTGACRIGLAIGYDLRFPELFRAMLDQGVQVIVIPAMFTVPTGRAHWETLLRARAIENLSFVVAAAQGGYHINGRETYGHSMIIDPWGTIMSRRDRGNGVITAKIDLDRQSMLRRSFPSIDHRRLKYAAPMEDV